MTRPRDPSIPSWYADASFNSNNPSKQAAALARWTLPVTTPEERRSAKTFRLKDTSLPCTICGKFRFPEPTVCFWCRPGTKT